MTARHAVVIPFLGRVESVVRCVTMLLAQAIDGTQVLLVDDGSTPAASTHPGIQSLLTRPNAHLIRHERNRGVAAARNSGLHWCRREGIELAVMIDSDCEPAPGFIREHVALLDAYPKVACIGGAVVGHGRGLSAAVDGVLSWPSNFPSGQTRDHTSRVYHLSTANMALRLPLLPAREFIFDERLNTNEDCLFIRELQDDGARILFSPKPAVRHHDREGVRAVLSHHYSWGYGTYFVQLGGDLSPRLFERRFRALFLLGFGAVLPVYALTGSALTILPWLRSRPMVAASFPAATLVWFLKGVAVMQAAVSPNDYLRETRPRVEYSEAG